MAERNCSLIAIVRLSDRKSTNSRTASNSMFERNSRNASNTTGYGYTRNVSNSRETSNRKPSGT